MSNCRNIEGHPLYQCTLKDELISTDSDIVVDGNFERVIVKLQLGEHEELTDGELTACSALKIMDERTEEETAPGNKSLSEKLAISKKMKALSTS